MTIYTGEELLALTQTVKSFCLFGPGLTGKTRSLWTLIKYLQAKQLGKLHLIDFDRKCESLVEKCRKEGILDWLVVKRLDVTETLNMDAARFGMNMDFFLSYQKLLNEYHDQVDFLTGTWKPGYEAPGAVVNDSMSTYARYCMQFTLGKLGHKLNAPGSNGQNDYGIAMDKLEETVQSLKTLPCITGWICHADLMQVGVDGRVIRLPISLGKKLSPKLHQYFNCTIYSPPPIEDDKGKEKYRWQVHGGGENEVEAAGVTGRDDLPLYIDPDFRHIFQ
jgi:hypothetical protein